MRLGKDGARPCVSAASNRMESGIWSRSAMPEPHAGMPGSARCQSLARAAPAQRRPIAARPAALGPVRMMQALALPVLGPGDDRLLAPVLAATADDPCDIDPVRRAGMFDQVAHHHRPTPAIMAPPSTRMVGPDPQESPSGAGRPSKPSGKATPPAKSGVAEDEIRTSGRRNMGHRIAAVARHRQPLPPQREAGTRDPEGDWRGGRGSNPRPPA